MVPGPLSDRTPTCPSPRSTRTSKFALLEQASDFPCLRPCPTLPENPRGKRPGCHRAEERRAEQRSVSASRSHRCDKAPPPPHRRSLLRMGWWLSQHSKFSLEEYVLYLKGRVVGNGEAEERSGVKGVEGRPARSPSRRRARRREAASPGMCGDGAPEKGKSSGPSARKGKGQIEKRKLREKRRSTGVVNIPAAECLDEYEDDEAGQKERKREDAITQQNTMQNEAASLLDPGSSYLLQEPSRTVSGKYKSTTIASEEDVSTRYPRTERSGFSRYNRDAGTSGNLVSSSMLEKKIEDLEKEVVRERQENLRLMRLMQDKEEMIGKLKEEIDLLNRDLDDIEDENEQLKQENKTLLKVVGQLTR
ncbi:PRKC apoptosis WT1 regulator protein [Suricata suricatta]|uniref:PRKC apoptosis WT1 regulator protein n=1 Tax=Suricata suricatta TaxID=37032 RepID=UPI001155C704|nr:PRKC apoptosis WT1 regulator protein [Suricata suricatta]